MYLTCTFILTHIFSKTTLPSTNSFKHMETLFFTYVTHYDTVSSVMSGFAF
jgi:hypothetical protein